MINTAKLFMSLIMVISLFSCGRGDYSSKIVGGYVYVDNGSNSRYIENESGKVVKDIVVSYGHDSEYIYALRQIENEFECEVDGVERTRRNYFVTGEFEYWVIKLSDHSKLGPFTQAQFDEYYQALHKAEKYPVSTVRDILLNKYGAMPTLEFECKNAKLLEEKN